MTVTVKNYNEIMKSYRVDINEAVRYCGGKDSKTAEIIRDCLPETEDIFDYNVCFLKCSVKVCGNTVIFPFYSVESSDLAKNLKGCESAVIFAATIGFGIDRIIKKYSELSPVKSTVFQAVGAERIESLCDAFNVWVAEEYGSTRPRFSAGYGDFPLEFQSEIFKILDCRKNIGIALNDSLLMSPTKSVTAIIGVEK